MSPCNLPILYSFRRCPYAIRARLAIKNSGVKVALREVLLADKPPQLLEISKKATVPVLHLADGVVIDQSLAIMHWALAIKDRNNWLLQSPITAPLIATNDGYFKHCLDRYKYSSRYPKHPPLFYRQQAEVFLAECESLLGKNRFLCGDAPSLADIAIFPFIRQFAQVDSVWFQASQYRKLQKWLAQHTASPLFGDVMGKYQPWRAGDTQLVF